jgi:hypothetical protein
MELISGSWGPASVSALAAIFGSLAGALGSAVSAWIAQRHQDRRDLLAKKIFHREQLYSDFISEGTKIIVDAAQHTFQDPGRLIPVYALLSRIRLSSSMIVVESAERVLKTILDIYSEPNLTPDEIKSKAAKGDDPLRDFSNIFRRDLESLWTGLLQKADKQSESRTSALERVGSHGQGYLQVFEGSLPDGEWKGNELNQ